MPLPLSNDLRKRIIESKLRGDTEEMIATEKDVHQSTVTKLWSLYRETGSYERGRQKACRIRRFR